MLIRKNTKAFKTILDIVWECQGRADREKLIRLYITKAGHTIQDRISVEGIQGEAALFYEMNYQSVLNNLQSSNHQLHVSDDTPGIYFFHSTSNKAWDETPFEFDEAIKKEFSSLPDLPAVRKKEKPEKFVFPTGKSEPTTKPKGKKEKTKATKEVKLKVTETRPKQPDFKLKHEIEFTDLERIIFKKAYVGKKEVLEYYNKIATNILPYLKDRSLYTRRYAPELSRHEEMSLEGLFEDRAESVPGWIPTKRNSRGKTEHEMLLCNDREHLLFYVERGCLEFDACFSKTKSLHTPDLMILVIESPDYELAQAIQVAHATKDVLNGLQLPSFVKTDGLSNLHIYIPLDSKSKFDVSRTAAAYVCKLIRLKIPDLVTLKGSDENGYRKVALDYTLNEEGKSVVAPYSLLPGESPTVATPLLWDEVEPGLRPEEFNHDTIFKRLKQVGDPFEPLFKKKVDADALLERLEKNYGFLLN